jgi:diketogulonate reductase-like aldo/keto reductase
MQAMEKLVSEGLVRFIGVSNFDVEDVVVAKRSLKDEQLTCNQVLHHLQYRGIERRLLQYCTENEIAVVGYSPFGHDNFPSPQTAGGKVLMEIANRYDCTPRQVALNFLTHNPNIFTIPKTCQLMHARENSESVSWKLSAQDLESIDRMFPIPDQDAPLEMI